FLINGSVNNGAASPFAQPRAFGNNRTGQRSLYTGGLGIVLGNSAWDARPFSFTLEPTPKSSYADAQASVTFGGPLKIPHVRSNPVVFVGYQRLLDHSSTTQSAVVPTLLERSGDLSQTHDVQGRPVALFDPQPGERCSGNIIPAERISPTAAALLFYYPKPNVEGNGRYNFQ